MWVNSAAKRIEPGPAAQRIVANLIRIRRERNLTFTEISAALEEVGRPIPILGLRRIEAGERRIDVDDIEALAHVLGVVPLALIYPIGTEEEVELLPHVRARPWEAAKWFTGEGGRPGAVETQLPAAAPIVSGGPISASTYVLDLHRRHDQFVTAWRDATKDTGARERAERDLVKLRADMATLGIATPPLPAGLRHIGPAEPTRRKARKQQ